MKNAFTSLETHFYIIVLLSKSILKNHVTQTGIRMETLYFRTLLQQIEIDL